MKEIERLNERRGISPVISTLILSSVVLVIGGVVWAFSQGAMTITAEDYTESVIDMTETISERFIIECVTYDGSHLKVWIYNYGSVEIEVKIQVGSVNHPLEWKEMTAGGFAALDPLSYDADSGDELAIKAYTRRGNNAFYRFIVP